MNTEDSVVWLAEDRDIGRDGGQLLLATFSGYCQRGSDVEECTGLMPAAALAWAHARSSQVWVATGLGEHVQVRTPHDERILQLRTRRPQGEEWRDRPDDGPAIAWVARVDVLLPSRAAAEALEAHVLRLADGHDARVDMDDFESGGGTVTSWAPDDAWCARSGEEDPGRSAWACIEAPEAASLEHVAARATVELRVRAPSASTAALAAGSLLRSPGAHASTMVRPS